jgi:hypothetical protein
MDTKFQTSFIPKKPILMDQKITHHGGTSIFMFVSIIIFILSIAGAVFSVIWKDVLIKQQKVHIGMINQAEERFDIATIEKLKKANLKITLGNRLLKEHLAVSEVFDIINRLTSDGIRFNSFEFTGGFNDKDGVKITMGGYGTSFSAIAWQSKVFGESEKFGKNKVLKNPILTNLQLNSVDGSVGFTFTATINPEDVLYEKVLVSETNTTNE